VLPIASAPGRAMGIAAPADGKHRVHAHIIAANRRSLRRRLRARDTGAPRGVLPLQRLAALGQARPAALAADCSRPISSCSWPHTTGPAGGPFVPSGTASGLLPRPQGVSV